MENNSRIKNLVLDFGGVIYNIDHERHKKAFKDLGVDNFDELYSQARQSPLFADFECGRVNPGQFLEQLTGFINRNIPAGTIEKAWNSILVGFDNKRTALLKKLPEKYRLFLLSNTNKIHYDIYTRQFSKRYGEDFNNLFSKTYWSFKIGMRKPDQEIYRLVMSENGLKSEQTLFIDDSFQNVVSADQAGLPSLLLESPLDLTDLFDGDLNLKL